jgi:hypothetical protein
MYIITSTAHEPWTTEERPKQSDALDWNGVGKDAVECSVGHEPADYTLHGADGRVLKHWHVAPNRRGTWTVAASSPIDLEGVSTLSLYRIRKALETAAKYWPAKQNDIRKVNKELERRAELLAQMDLRLPPPATRKRAKKAVAA